MCAQTLNPITLAIAAVAAASVVGCNELDRSFSYSTAPTQEDQDRRYCEIEARAMIPDASPPVRRTDEREYGLTPGNLYRLQSHLQELQNVSDRGFLVDRCMKKLGYK